MQETNILYQCLLAVISVAVPILSAFAIKFFQTKVGNENLKKYDYFITAAVKAAEESFNTPKAGTSKKLAVAKYISELVDGALSPADIDKLIDAAVFEINKTKQKTIYLSPDTAPGFSPTTYPWMTTPTSTGGNNP